MSSKVTAYWSTVGKKVFMALTGLAMVVFLVEHLSGNLLLLAARSEPYNTYAHTLLSLGWLLVPAELILLAFLLVHMLAGVQVTLSKRRARPRAYRVLKSAGAPSRKTLASSTMIISGIVLFLFLVAHLYTFKYGPGIEQGYVAEIRGETGRDLYRLVMEKFQDPIYVVGYSLVMLLLGLHLRHGFWSAFQSLGADHPRYSRLISTLGVVVSILLGAGFLLIPAWIYLRGLS